MTIFETVKEIIIEKLNVEDSYITPEASFIYDLGVDSIDAVSLIMAFEERFDISIIEEIYDSLHTVQDVINYIDSADGLLSENER
ncbi:MAG: acyl carrier protein [Leptospirales bacterium]|nr:acyl carrier protein [Leptospirales bacterium]